jgi:hypothetical protein
MSYAPGGAIARSCPSCHFVSWPKPEWDESPHPNYCPHCGLGLALRVCRECSGPLAVISGGSGFILFGGPSIARCCPHCGADNGEQKEPAMVVKKKKGNPNQEARDVIRSCISGFSGLTISYEPAEGPAKKPRKRPTKRKRADKRTSGENEK